jgi:glycosyltransferase involved in cell wall biosynthesis
MNWTTQCAVVIPCLNEAARITRVVIAARRFVPAVFVVDDGSRDGTRAAAVQAGAEVLRHEFPQGKGAALQTGWTHAKSLGFHWALSMDGDGQHSANDIPKFFAAAEQTHAPLIIGNRMEDPRDMPRLRRWVNHWMSRRISALARMPLPDSQCGFRLMNLQTWASLPVNAAHFEIESDLLLVFARSECPIEFVPIEVIYKSEQSKIHPVRDTVRWFRWWWRARQMAPGMGGSRSMNTVLPVPSE